jgi:hypothetical protein
VTATSTASAEPVKRRRRPGWIVATVLLLLIGLGLLGFSLLTKSDKANPASAAPSPSPTTTLSPVAQTQTVAATPPPTPGATPGSPVVVVLTSYVAVPTYVTAFPAVSSSPDQSDIVALVTAVSGLLASVLGLVSAFVSIRGTRVR